MVHRRPSRPSLEQGGTDAGPDGRLPNLFVIGVPKSATTLVHEALDLAPGVFMSTVKEPGFFTNSSDRRRGLDYYLDAYFAHAEGHPIRGESTPWYFYSDEARERIAELPASEARRFLVVLRRPSRRAQSMYFDQVRLNREQRDFAEAIEAELEGLEAGRLVQDVRQRYVWGGLYADHLAQWIDRFGCDRVHVAYFEEVLADPGAVWADLAEFLGHDLGPERFEAVRTRDQNRSGVLRWPRVDRFLRSLEGRDNRAIEAAKRVLPPGLHRRVLQRFGRLNRRSQLPMPVVQHDDVLRRLDEYYADDVERVATLVGRVPECWFGDGP
jgi:hypothetical protein